MANFHVRSNSLPSKSHPIVNYVEDQLCRLRSSEGTSTSATSVITKLASLRDLHEGINNLLQMPSTQQALCHENSEKWTNKLLEESLGLVDLCGFARDVVSLTKGSVQDLQSSIRRNRVLKSVLILLSGENGKQRNWSFLSKFTRTSRVDSERDQERGAESLLSLELHKSGKDIDVQNVLKQLKASEMAIQELEEEVDAFFSSLVKTRVSLLNALNH
ncbi:UNVERIFIED_CONTAM: hypothetical protein Slati_2313700 [Sesamum latifolium]|uniref:Uncharacterized protein n=1 Tax=Sesamum latifolium TaxID=2727402 RepID=A0AAW2W9L4_9LAMI